jgi:3-dehydroquinate synthase/shikimate kinase/3-dehydroquinate synthase
MNLIKLHVKTANQKYPIFIGNNILNKLKIILKKNFINFNQCLIIVDKNVPKKLVDNVLNSLPKKKISLIYFNPNEKNKNQRKKIKKVTKTMKKKLKKILKKNMKTKKKY